MNPITPKKSLGQHFLKDQNIARKIVSALVPDHYQRVLEVGPGMGILSGILFENPVYTTFLSEIDKEAIEYLSEHFPEHKERIIQGDFLSIDLPSLISPPFAVIGNFPYNISSQIFFKILQYKDSIPQVVCMIQKEVAERIVTPPGSKTYGILSVLLQAYYSIEYLFTVHEHVFSPPPRVKSAVIRLNRNMVGKLECDETLFFKVVKTTFNQRRKTIHNSLKPLITTHPEHHLFTMRPEQLSVQDFVILTRMVASHLPQKSRV